MDTLWFIALVLLSNWKTIEAFCNGTYTVGENKVDPTKSVTVDFQHSFCKKPAGIDATVAGSAKFGDTFAVLPTSISRCEFSADVTRLEEVKTWWQTDVVLTWRARFDPLSPPSSSNAKSTECQVDQENCIDGQLCEAEYHGCVDGAIWNGLACACQSGFEVIGSRCEDVNECESPLNACQSHSTCTNSMGSYTCQCDTGFRTNGGECTDVNECSEKIDGCHVNATCTNSIGNYTCKCKDGFAGNGTLCEDINECLATIRPCHEHASCANVPGSYSCACESGFRGNGSYCQDINECVEKTDDCHNNASCLNDVDECTLQTHGCHPNATCQNYHGDHACFCKEGYSGDGISCQDVDECSLQTHRCHGNATCQNYEGGHLCICDSGFSGDGINCLDVNECLLQTHQCHKNATCQNFYGGHECICKQGFSGDGQNCQDLDECSLQTHHCHDNATCKNYDGGHLCICDSGFSGDGINCQDVNECLLQTHQCHKNATCQNFYGGHECICKQGFSGDGQNCQDLDECSLQTHHCHDNATCKNYDGGHLCICDSGFSGDGINCQDVNECLLQTHQCHKNATCQNFYGGHECICKQGFSGDGQNCQDLDECSLQTHHCHGNATCKNYDGGHLCICDSGFSGDGMNCRDVNECLLQTHQCHRNATCQNFDGGHECICKKGFSGDGQNCQDLDECLLQTHRCHGNATCKNYDGGHLCICDGGFSGDGISCQDVNECLLHIHDCHENASCFNHEGGHECICKDGFSGHGQHCHDENECNLQTHDCHKNATCTNAVPGYNCQCNHGFHGNGTNCIEYCDPAVLEDFSFDYAYVGETQQSNERCPGGKPATTALCLDNFPKRAYFQLIPFTGCDMDLAQITAMSKSTEDFAIATKHVQSLVSSSSNLTEEQVNNVVNYLQDITTLAENGSINVSTSTFSSMLSVVDNLVENQFNSSGGKEVTEKDKQNQQNLVKSIASMALFVQLNKSNPIFNYQSNSFDMEVKQDDGSDFPKVTFTANNAVDVILPPSAVRSAWATTSGNNDSERRSAFVYYKDDSLFYSENGVHSVISVDVGNKENLQNLTDPVIIKFLDQHARFSETHVKDKNKLQAIKTSARCAYWDFNTSRWLSDGCCLNTTSDPPECLCYHLTNFALIVKSETVPTDAALTIVSYVGCVASICGLFLTIALHLWLREIRRRRPVKILVNICANLMIADIVFLAGVTRSENPAACTAVTAILHFFLLTTWCWMTVYSYDMYMSVVKVFRNDAGSFMQRVSAFAYVTPAVIALLTVSIAVGHFDQIPQDSGLCNTELNPFKTSVYRAENMCWLRGYSLYFGFLLPVGILATFNLFCFALIFREIVCKKMEGRTRAMKRTNTQNFLIAFTMAAVMGMTWIFGYFMLISEDVTYLRVMSWLFAVVNSAQGVSIFILTTLRSQELRRVWWNPLRFCCGQAPSATSRFMSQTTFKTSMGSFRPHNGRGNTTFTEASNGDRGNSVNFHSTSINGGS